MNPRKVSELVVREAPLLRVDQRVDDAVEALLASGLPALPVVGEKGFAGIFGEREFFEALFPGYVRELRHAGFVPRELNQALEKRAICAGEPVGDYMLSERVEIGGDFSDVQVAETFLHHRVLIVPVVEDRQVQGVITRSEFFRQLAERFLER